jgi:hypothetical protein
MRGNKLRPLCCDCGIDTIATDEWYMVNNEVWEQAWSGHRCPTYISLGLFTVPQPPPPGLEVLCIGCLENRIGRTLCRTDFIDVPVNDPNRLQLSNRLLDRLAADMSHLLVARRPA